jgi:uncharacterized protein HemY
MTILMTILMITAILILIGVMYAIFWLLAIFTLLSNKIQAFENTTKEFCKVFNETLGGVIKTFEEGMTKHEI